MAATGACTQLTYLGSHRRLALARASTQKLRDMFWNREIFNSMKELSVLAERWCVHDNLVKPDLSLGQNRPVRSVLRTKG